MGVRVNRSMDEVRDETELVNINKVSERLIYLLGKYPESPATDTFYIGKHARKSTSGMSPTSAATVISSAIASAIGREQSDVAVKVEFPNRQQRGTILVTVAAP